MIALGLIGVACLSLTVGFIVGVAWGTRLYAAIAAEKSRVAASGEDETPTLAPQMWTPQRMAAAMGNQAGPKRRLDVPNSYAPPGLDG